MSLLNTTFTTHRLSPLHVGTEPLSRARLQILSNRLRDLLVGDTVRGVQVGLDPNETTLSHTGALDHVRWEWRRLPELFGQDVDGAAGHQDSLNEEEGEPGPKALLIELRYENNAFSAIFLPSFDSQDSATSNRRSTNYTNAQWTSHPSVSPLNGATDPRSAFFLSLPLLLFRMPAPLRSTVADFIAQTFDCRISALRANGTTLVTLFEQWLAGSASLAKTSKDVVMTLGFETDHVLNPKAHHGDNVDDAPDKQASGIKSVDITIPAQDVRSFVAAGRRGTGGQQQPFMEALTIYVKQHLALDMGHAGVRILKIVCEGFALSESRVKVSQGGQAGQALLQSLVHEAQGETP